MSSLDPKRHPGAIAAAITKAWIPYRRRAYVVGVALGFLAGGIAAPIATTVLIMGVSVSGATVPGGRWPEVVWSTVFAVGMAVGSATAFARWQPKPLLMASQTYIWLAMRAEEHWIRVFGTPVPRDEAATRTVLASMPETVETSAERCSLWTGILELDRARAAARDMPETNARERFKRASAFWLLDFVGGATASLDALHVLAEALEQPQDRLEARATMALSRARVALAESQAWPAPLAAVRPELGSSPDAYWNQMLWWPTFNRILTIAIIGVAIFWIVSSRSVGQNWLH